ncbi:lactonase family protein [Pedobacter sp. JY14-1]|uniref:lactonase family protein n=1 Tax=Pedobacter sp. JY14-1 TaxID=3034151 RepID=UPI0023E34B30|nr:lactonase family protein [Pedobacter sp. JY14-1]
MRRLFVSLLMTLTIQTLAQEKFHNLLIGTYTGEGKGEGIYVYQFGSETGAFKLRSTAKGVANPSYLALAPGNRLVYAVNESGDKSSASAFTFDPESGTLKFINRIPAGGNDPCYIIADEKHVITANYSGGSLTVFGVNADGGLTKAKQLIRHNGSSINKSRQEAPHVHMVAFSPERKYVTVNDLGTDKVYLYSYHPDDNNNVLIPADSISLTPGAGPRHLTFSKDGKYAYVLHELDGGLTVMSYTEGQLNTIQETSINSPGFSGENGGADIHLSPDGRFLYASNRGSENKITIFAVEKGGILNRLSQVSTMGKGPRNFAITPNGKFLLVANQNSNEVVIFSRDLKSGMLKDTGKRICVGAPVCLVFTPAS